ncbi:unnamed protein product [Ambrosiozyma monospora]|uniref:Unnamed protein product n=1 Tax=Ambrosiozyma monospora TaxID=43982 RepID=A0A9W6ST59_AMBMO|nr:unnamed protein product [Ambrosiozyma monospora]
MKETSNTNTNTTSNCNNNTTTNANKIKALKGLKNDVEEDNKTIMVHKENEKKLNSDLQSQLELISGFSL